MEVEHAWKRLARTLLTVALTLVTVRATPALARHQRSTTTTTLGGSTTTTTLPPGTPAGFEMIDSALGALLDEVNAEPVSAHLRSQLLNKIGHAQGDVARAASLLSMHDRRSTKDALEHAIRWMITFHYRAGSNSGRRGGADHAKLFPMVDAILQQLRTLRRSL